MTRKEEGFSLLQVPIGWIGIVANEQKIKEVFLTTTQDRLRSEILGKYPLAQPVTDGPAAKGCKQVAEYFLGQRIRFDLELDWSVCSDFARQVLQTLAEVHRGETLTYGELARMAGYPGRARGVGQVMAKNPFPLVVPCHRVVGSGGQLTGYSGGEGLETKRWLLDFEKKSG